MMRGAWARWIEAARSVGRALLEVLAAEAAELKRDLARSGRELRLGALLLLAAAGLAFWTLGLALCTLVVLLAARLSLLAALAVVSGGGVLLTLLLLGLGKWRLGRVETPVRAFTRRGRDHVEWWQHEVMPGLVGDGGGPRERRGTAPADDEGSGRGERDGLEER